ncbi:MAG: DUF3995 domain-containing protein [Actinomycetota bacterium]
MDATIAAGGLLLLAVAHSVLGETGFIRPLLAADWTIAEVPRWAANRLLRIAWHLTSLAWVGLAAIALDASALAAVGLVALASAVLMAVALPAHFAWPIFLLAGLGALRADGALPDGVVTAAGWVSAAVLVAVAVLHVHWAAGGRWGYEVVLPADGDGGPAFVPGALLTLAVAAAIATFAGLVAARLLAVDHWLLTTAIAVGTGVFALRAIGDGRQAGFSKSDRSTPFAKADDRWFTPLVTLLAFGAGGTLLI